MPAKVELDLTALWHRETELVGAYTYGTEHLPEGGPVRTFDLAFRLVTDADLARLVSDRYPIEDYRQAIEHAAEAGRRDAVKIVFDLT
jgi:threonine dehydrogenase-like Zn-dependent dehydrogenase